MFPKRLLALILFAALAVMQPCVLRAQWVQTTQPLYDTLLQYNSDVASFAVIESNLFVVTNKGIFLSTNYGLSWKNASMGLPEDGVTSLTVSASSLYAAVYDGGDDEDIFLSTNNGSSWRAISIGLIPFDIDVLAVNGVNIFASGIGNFLSTNNGVSWRAANTGIHGFVVALTDIGSNLFAGTANAGVFLSTNNGVGWRAVSSGLPVVFKNDLDTSVSALIARGTNLFAGTENGVYSSTNNGISWTQATSGLAIYHVSSFAVNGMNIYVAANSVDSSGVRQLGRVFLSTDDGASWAALNNGLTNNKEGINALTICGKFLFAGTCNGNVWKYPLN